jgi:hypothetical protein
MRMSNPHEIPKRLREVEARTEFLERFASADENTLPIEDPEARFPAGPFTTALAVDNRANGAGRLQPGQSGWWPLWGPHALDIASGDRLMTGYKDDDGIIRHNEYEVVELAPWGDLRDSCRVRFLTTAGQYRSVGMLQPMQLLRPGTHNTLSRHCR